MSSSQQPHEEGIIPVLQMGETEIEEMKCQAQGCLTSVSPRIQSQDCPRAQFLKGQPSSSELHWEAWYRLVSHTLWQDPLCPHSGSLALLTSPGIQMLVLWGPLGKGPG